MRKDAEKFAETDKKKKEEIEVVNQADTFVYTTERTLKDMEGKVSEADIKSVKDKVSELKKLLEQKEKDVGKIKKLLDEAVEVMQKAATELYKQSAAPHPAGPHEHAETAKDDVVDAEVVDEKKSKKK